ncbi:hypothetical protein GGI07_003861 [Coemansia sp. Benny D115]|nr:hypothetical protein GGI07_003861 [Coemansia sp. Benny D115]
MHDSPKDTLESRTDAPDTPPRPHLRATLLIPEGGVLATRVHYETLNDAMFLVRVTLLSSVLCLAAVILLSLATANVDIKLGIMAIASYPKLLFSSSVWSSTSVFSAIQVAWFMAYCAFSHLIRLHFNTTDPPRDWDDRNGEWSVIELDVRVAPKPEGLRSNTANVGTTSSGAATAAAVLEQDAVASASFGAVGSAPCLSKSVADQWRLCVPPTPAAGAGAAQPDVTLLTPDLDYYHWKARAAGM